MEPHLEQTQALLLEWKKRACVEWSGFLPNHTGPGPGRPPRNGVHWAEEAAHCEHVASVAACLQRRQETIARFRKR